MSVTILVNSCDLYEDTWYPFFKLLSIQWPDCPYKLVLNTENKVFKCDEFSQVETICGGEKPWSDRVLYALDNIDSEYILFFLEDQFLRQTVNVEWFNHSLEYIKSDKNVGVIFLRHTEKQEKRISDDFFPRSMVTDKFPIVGMVALYRKEYLKLLLRKGESAWDFESNGSARSKEMDYKVLQYNNSKPQIFVYDDKIERGYGITQRKWLPRNKELFDKYNIKVNFENLGFFDVEKYLIEKKEKEKEKEMLKKAAYKEMSLIEKIHTIKKHLFKK